MQTIALLHEQSPVEQMIIVPAQETLDYFFVLFADAPIERRIRFELADGARVNVRGVIMGSAAADIVFETDIVHRGRNTEGFTTVKGILSDRAKATVTGLIRIPESGNNTNAFLEQRFLLLSKNARAKAEPMLEILANDVKASHAASISRLNDEQMFYCESRGLGLHKSRQLLTEAFVNAIIEKIPDETVVDACRTYLSTILSCARIRE